MSTDQVLKYTYKFQFDDKSEKQFEVLLHSETLELLHSPNPNPPPWTKLKFNQCENCPLSDATEYCPVALNLSYVINEFKFSTSHDKTWVVVESPERTYAQETSVQDGLSSIMGIYMVTSNCPILDNLRPMARFHLPFASAMESVYRSVSMYLMAQYFRFRRGEQTDWDLEKLLDVYKEIAKVNKGLWNRLSKASGFDANVNALIVLNTFGDAVRFSLKKDLDDIAKIFSSYFDKKK
jgi:hypothetical protein